jgi:hypothetical protein
VSTFRKSRKADPSRLPFRPVEAVAHGGGDVATDEAARDLQPPAPAARIGSKLSLSQTITGHFWRTKKAR